MEKVVESSAKTKLKIKFSVGMKKSYQGALEMGKESRKPPPVCSLHQGINRTQRGGR